MFVHRNIILFYKRSVLLVCLSVCHKAAIHRHDFKEKCQKQTKEPKGNAAALRSSMMQVIIYPVSHRKILRKMGRVIGV